MASKKIHLAQAGHNQKLANKLLTGDYYDWACTTAFYSALHYVEAKFNDIPEIVHSDEAYKKNRQTMEDQDINLGVHLFREVALSGKYPLLRNSYRHLREVSSQVRYLDHDKTACDFINIDTAKSLVKNDLTKIKKGLGF
jgi:hypothetical protein